MNSYTSAVATPHPDLLKFLPKWQKVRRVLDGDVKGYLRDVGRNEANAEYGRLRQEEYEDGAVFFNFTKRTLSGMVGSVMRRDPEIVLPDSMSYLLNDVDGGGMGLVQQAKDVLADVCAIGRGGLLVDAPAHDGVATAADQAAGLLNPRIGFYPAESIINWRTHRQGSSVKLSMLVLREVWEYHEEGDSEFITHYGMQYRVLDFDANGRYRQRLFKFKQGGGAVGEVEEVFPDLGPSFKGVIPFQIIGSGNNDIFIDDVPLTPLAELNIGHFRNSADNEESSFMVGQPTLFITTSVSTEAFVRANPDGVRMGSRTGHNLGATGSAWLVQATETNLPSKNMLAKEQQAIQIGAQLITPSQQITAESARIQRAADTSVLSSVAHNVSAAYTQALIWVAGMLRLRDTPELTLSTEFFMAQMTAQDRAAWMADINAGLLPATAYYAALRKAGVTDWSDADIKEAIEDQPIPVRGQASQVEGDIPAVAQQQNDEAQQ